MLWNAKGLLRSVKFCHEWLISGDRRISTWDMPQHVQGLGTRRKTQRVIFSGSAACSRCNFASSHSRDSVKNLTEGGWSDDVVNRFGTLADCAKIVIT